MCSTKQRENIIIHIHLLQPTKGTTAYKYNTSPKSNSPSVHWVTWEVVTGVDGTLSRGEIILALADVTLLYPSQGGRYRAEGSMALGRDRVEVIVLKGAWHWVERRWKVSC